MKSNSGVTLTALTIYIIALTIVVAIIARISIYFYRNVNNINSNTTASTEYTKFNSYFTDEINIEENQVADCDVDASGMQYIIFSKTQNQYSYKNGSIYRNRTKIASNIDECNFIYDTNTKIITVNLTINGKIFNTNYTVVK